MSEKLLFDFTQNNNKNYIIVPQTFVNYLGLTNYQNSKYSLHRYYIVSLYESDQRSQFSFSWRRKHTFKSHVFLEMTARNWLTSKDRLNVIHKYRL